MKEFFRNLWRSGARKYFLIGVLVASGVGTPLAVSIGTGIDEGIEQIEQQITEGQSDGE